MFKSYKIEIYTFIARQYPKLLLSFIVQFLTDKKEENNSSLKISDFYWLFMTTFTERVLHTAAFVLTS